MTANEYIDRQTFDHLVNLAAIELDETQAQYLLRELNNQLNAVQELAAIPLDNVSSGTSHGVAYTAEISASPRPDEWIPFENPQQILEQSPKNEDGYFIVPDIPHTTLD